MSRLGEMFQTQLPLRSLFEMPTVAELALAIERAQLSGQKPGGEKITRLARGEQGIDTLVEEIGKLSAAEVQTLLAQVTPASGNSRRADE
jgi:hypothetical protein